MSTSTARRVRREARHRLTVLLTIDSVGVTGIVLYAGWVTVTDPADSYVPLALAAIAGIGLALALASIPDVVTPGAGRRAVVRATWMVAAGLLINTAGTIALGSGVHADVHVGGFLLLLIFGDLISIAYLWQLRRLAMNGIGDRRAQ